MVLFSGPRVLASPGTLRAVIICDKTACANERSCGSARGVISNGRPYRDLIGWTPGNSNALCGIPLQEKRGLSVEFIYCRLYIDVE